MKAYRSFKLVPNLSQIVGPDEAEAALKRGCDDLMAIAEYALQDRPWALSNAREAYTVLCARLYRAIEEASR
jgi:hypothetical protein